MADTLTTWSLVVETREWVGPITVTINGVPVTAFQVSVSALGRRPSTWVDPTVLDGKRGVLVGVGTSFPLALGKYVVWTKFTDNPEAPVLRVGQIKVS